ncbi:MAG: Rid family hydrolase [Candidatus Binatia bacterium]
MPRTPVFPPGVTPPKVPFSPGVLADNVLYVSGVLSLDKLDKDGKTIGVGDIRVQTRQVIETIKSIVEAAGGTLDDVVYNAIFIRNLSDYPGLNEVYAEYFGVRPPARYCIRADLVPPDCLVEISSIAHLPR